MSKLIKGDGEAQLLGATHKRCPRALAVAAEIEQSVHSHQDNYI